MKRITRKVTTQFYVTDAHTAPIDFEPVLRHPLIEALQRVAWEMLGLTFVIHRVSGPDPDGNEVKACAFTSGQPMYNAFCRSLFAQPASNEACRRSYDPVFPALMRERSYQTVPCRFSGAMHCIHAIPIEPRAGLLPAFAIMIGLRHRGAPPPPFERIRETVRAEHPDADWALLEDQYRQTPVAEPGLLTDYFHLAKFALDRVTLELMDSPVAPPADAAEATLHFLESEKRKLFAPGMMRNDLPVILEGEAGAGKEVLARFLHRRGARGSEPFVVVPCATLSPDLVEAELFGYEKGAFSGALRDFAGFFERAHGGALYFDEIAEFPLDVQSRLLRVIETGEFRRIGSAVTRRVNVRIYTGTRRDLRRCMEQGRFLRALYYRIHGLHVAIPPLRDTPGDIPEYAGSFLEEAQPAGRPPKRFTEDALRALRAYAWPGNLRQLRNVVLQAAALARQKIGLRHLPEEIRAASTAAAPAGSLKKTMAAAVDAATRRHYTAALEHARGDSTAAARLLGVSRATLYRKFKPWGIDA